MCTVQVLEFSRAEVERNLVKMIYSNNTSFIYNSQAEIFECKIKVGYIIVNNAVTKLNNEISFLNGNATLDTPLGTLQILFTTNILTDKGDIGNKQIIKCSIVHSTGIYEKATSVNIESLDDIDKTSVVFITF
jgi:hypothetical protein